MNRSLDSRSDLYALGVTFYEMLIERPQAELEQLAVMRGAPQSGFSINNISTDGTKHAS
jgi:serine/threonine protein kinase